MKINNIIQHIIFISVFGVLAAKLGEGQPLSVLLLMNPVLLLIGIIYGMFLMKRIFDQTMDETIKSLQDKLK